MELTCRNGAFAELVKQYQRPWRGASDCQRDLVKIDHEGRLNLGYNWSTKLCCGLSWRRINNLGHRLSRLNTGENYSRLINILTTISILGTYFYQRYPKLQMRLAQSWYRKLNLTKKRIKPTSQSYSTVKISSHDTSADLPEPYIVSTQSTQGTLLSLPSMTSWIQTCFKYTL
jgi:hypothetical protein